MQSSDYQNIGQYLKESRESLRVSLEEASAHLHIRVKYLRAIEAGDLKEMPGKAYIRGYLKNYAHYLRLDTGEVLSAYAGLLGGKGHELYLPESSTQQNLPTNWILWICLGALALIYGFWYAFYHDHTAMRGGAPDLPARLAHLLDKPLPGMVDNGWKSCLAGDDAGCYVTVRARIIQTHSIYYELHAIDLTTEEDEP